MKTKTYVIAASAACCMASAAMANNLFENGQFDELIVVNGGEAITLASGESVTVTANISSNVGFAGFTFAGVFVDETGGTWASDTRLDVVAPDGQTYSIGGFGTDSADNDWDFQGGQSSDDGAYFHGIGGDGWDGDGNFDTVFSPPVTMAGEWSFTLTQQFGAATWKGVNITLHAIPAPGALALLGLAGLAGAGRRRRA